MNQESSEHTVLLQFRIAFPKVQPKFIREATSKSLGLRDKMKQEASHKTRVINFPLCESHFLPQRVVA